LDDEATGKVELDDIVCGEGGGGERSYDDLDTHHGEEKHADGELGGEYSAALIVCVFTSVDVIQALR